MTTIENRPLNTLRPHPVNVEVYGDHADAELIESVKANGILNPLLVTVDGRIISGHRRADAAQKAGLAEVPVVVFERLDEPAILEALVESNRQRQKTNEQLGREYALLKKVYHEKNSRQGERTSDKNLSEVPRPTRQAAESLGTTQVTANRAEAVVEAIDLLESEGKKREASQLRSTLNGASINKAYVTARENGYIQPKQAERREAAPKYISLAEWRGMDIEQQQSALECVADRSNKSMNFQEDNNIEWALWSWNPVTGCLHNCSYCYARDIANRFFESKFAPALWPERLAAPRNVKVPAEAESHIGYKNVFTCSMADLFGRWVPAEWIQAALDTVEANPQWNFLFLTKFPGRLAEFNFPANAWVGATVDAQARVPFVEKAFARVNAPVKWLSCEPLLEPLKFSRLDLFQWVVIGGASKSTETPEFRPPRSWIEDLEAQARAAGCRIYEKTNLLDRLREYPGDTGADAIDIPEAFKLGYLQRDLRDLQTYEAELRVSADSPTAVRR